MILRVSGSAARRVIYASAISVILTGCGGAGGDSTTPNPPVTNPTVTGVTLSASSVSLAIGQSKQISATVAATSTAPTTVTWTTDNSAVATIDASGVITGKGVGTTVVTATSTFDASRKASAPVVVVAVVPVASVTVAALPGSLLAGQTAQLSATAKDSTGAAITGRTVTWSSSDANIATVSTTGLVTARALGTATISATIDGKIGTTAVTVAPPAPLFTVAPVPVGARHGTITLTGPEEAVFTPSDESAMGVLPMPDEHQPYLTFNDGTTRFWLTNRNGTGLFTTADFKTFTPNTTNGSVTTVLGPSAPLSSAYDADYAGASTVFTAANGKDLLMLYHAENHYGRPYGATGVTAFYASVGLARSTDNGLTWTRQGAVITGRDAQPAYPPDVPGIGAANPSALVSGGFIYVTYVDEVSKGGPYKGINQQCFARAPISSDGAVGSWSKLYQGSYSQPGIGGNCASPIPAPTAASGITFVSNGELSYNSALNSYVLVFLGDDGFFYSTSQDMLTWTKPEQLLQTPPHLASLNTAGATYYYYPTLISPTSSSDQITTSDGYLYYAKGVQNAALGQNAHAWYRQKFTVTP